MAFMGLWWIFGVVLLAAIAWGLLRIGRGAADRPHEAPEDILKRRYASGELDREAYERMRADLKH